MDPFTPQVLYVIFFTYIFVFAPVYAICIICDIFRKLLSEDYRLELCHMYLSSDDDDDDAHEDESNDNDYDLGSPESKPKNQ
jgi:hypothetical protein